MLSIIVILMLFSMVNSIRIGKIENNIMIGIKNNSLVNITLDQCICQMTNFNEVFSGLKLLSDKSELSLILFQY